MRVWLILGVVMGLAALSSSSGAQPQDKGDLKNGRISLNFPENLELKVLTEYVSQRLGLNILYDEQIGNRRVTIKAPSKIPEGSLLGLFESALQMKGLALVDAGQKGWKRIVATNNLLAIAKGPEEAQRLAASGAAGPTLAVTQVFELKHANTKRAEAVIKPFLTQPGANSLGVPESDLLIVTDYASNMRRVAGLIRLVDQPTDEIIIEFVPVNFQEAAQLAQHALKLIRAKILAELRAKGAGGPAAEGLDVTHDERTNQVVVVGARERVADAIQVIQSLDISLGLSTRVYQFEHASPERIDRLTKELIGPLDAKRLYRSAVDQDAGLLVAASTPEVHEKIVSLKQDLDVPISDAQSPIRFYKLTNTTAADVLETIRALESEEGFAEAGADGVGSDRIPGANLPPSEPGEPPPGLSPDQRQQAEGTTSLQPIRQTVRSTRATMTADTNTNTIIIVAEPHVQQIYERLIEALDRRRPQVLVEVTIVTIDTSDDFSLGVAIGHEHTAGEARTLTFSSFDGLNTADATNAAISLIPGFGFNGAIISPDIADLVIKALKQDSHTRVVSAPRILVNDNATGTLESISEEPFTSVNASDTVSTTSFGGFVEAGTTITATPHISEGDHLTLEYSISLNSFSGDGANGIPPPRQTNSIESEVTVLDGHTLIVGGLNRTDDIRKVNAVPILGQIPIIKHLFRDESTEKGQTTLFVFIRPVILRDDQFADLKFISKRQLEIAGLPGDFPTSEPLMIY